MYHNYNYEYTIQYFYCYLMLEIKNLTNIKSLFSKINENSEFEIMFYNYNSDNKLFTGGSNNELSRMMQSQREKLHQEVLDMILSMLNKGLLVRKNKPIEPNEKNAKLIKAFIYRQISEKNPQMGGMDKIMIFKAMSEDEIINSIKTIPDLDELEKNIQKHIQEKQSQEKKTTKKSVNNSETNNSDTSQTDTTESENLKKKVSKKVSKKDSKKVVKKVAKK